MVKKEHDRDPYSIDIQRVLLAFFLGFCQAIIAIVVELLVVVYLTSLIQLIDVVVKFVSLAAIAKFDDMYANALQMKKLDDFTGTKLPTEFKRRMLFLTSEEREHHNQQIKESMAEDDSGKPRDYSKASLCKEEYHFPNPREGYWVLHLLRVIHKCIRMFYVSVNYYFTPFIALAVTFGMGHSMSSCGVK